MFNISDALHHQGAGEPVDLEGPHGKITVYLRKTEGNEAYETLFEAKTVPARDQRRQDVIGNLGIDVVTKMCASYEGVMAFERLAGLTDAVIRRFQREVFPGTILLGWLDENGDRVFDDDQAEHLLSIDWVFAAVRKYACDSQPAILREMKTLLEELKVKKSGPPSNGGLPTKPTSRSTGPGNNKPIRSTPNGGGRSKAHRKPSKANSSPN